MMDAPRIKRAQSCKVDAREAVRDFHAAVAQPDSALVIFFCAGDYDLTALAEEMSRAFAGVQVVGCTTAGEIGPEGYRDHSLSGVSLPSGSFGAVAGRLDALQQFRVADGQALAAALLQELESRVPAANAGNSFALQLIDGMSMREELVTHVVQEALGEVPLIGGSAGDGLRFGHTQVYVDGRFWLDSAVVALITTRLPFRLFKIQHFVATERRLVVTAADVVHRTVQELDGRPAAGEYVRALNVGEPDPDPRRFVAWPVVVVIDGSNYVRSIQTANPDGSLTFFSAIEEGLVLRVAKGVDLLANLEKSFDGIRSEIGSPQLVLGCDCILRRLEIAQSPKKDRIVEVLKDNNVVGFNTYGEQFRGIHVNQTLVGVAFGRDSGGADHA